MLWVVILACAVSTEFCDGVKVDSLVVTTNQGRVRGYKDPGGDLYVFYGVPYAMAPSGSQRFQAPLPPPVRMDILEAIDKKLICPQYTYLALNLNDNREHIENCLIANVYVPQTEEKKLPVLVYIHGGAFIMGFGDFKTLKQLAKSKKVVIVNFNYRLGAHGFLCLGTKNVPGNAGMKDQVALLRWVKDNIAGFGGNPDDVTIAGYSAGSSSVDLLTLSKMANGLFHKVIHESGASTSTFSIQLNPTEIAKNYAQQLNFTNVEDIYALEEFYIKAPYNLLTSVNVIDNVDGTVTFAPCVERDVGVERFLDDSPVNILKSGNYQKRPMLHGNTKMEGIVRLNMFEIWKEKMNTDFSHLLPANLQFENENDKEKVAVQVKQFYFGVKPIDGDNVMGYINYFTDIMFAYPTFVSLRFHVEAGNNQIYLYEYAYADDSSPLIPYIGIHGADHCTETLAIHDGLNFTHNDETMASNNYKYMKRIMRELWLNFVTISKPVPEGSSLPTWSPTGPNLSPYMALDMVPQLMHTPLLEQRMRFWDEIYSKHYRQPIPPTTPGVMHNKL